MKNSGEKYMASSGVILRKGFFRRLLIAVALVALMALPTTVLASDGPSTPSDPSTDALPLSALKEAHEAQSSLASELTNAQVASELPRHDLDRTEALQLLEGVFEVALQSPAGTFDSLDVKRLISPMAAVVYPARPDGSSAVSVGGEPEGASSGSPALLESTVPLAILTPDGGSEPVDLSLEHSDQEIRSIAAVEPVSIPVELGDGLELPASDIGIELVGAPTERTPSIIEESVAAYPNVDTDTDFAIAPTATGVETLTTLRSPTAPRTQVFRLDLPAGASLAEADPGAKVVAAGETILNVLPPSAIDARGANVPVSMEVSGDTLSVTASPQPGAAYPILVDPMYEGYAWKNGATSGWAGWYPASNDPNMRLSYGSGWGAGFNGIYDEPWPGTFAAGATATWTHSVPRYVELMEQGITPTSYISNLSLQSLYFATSAGAPSPYLYTGIFDPTISKWAGKPGNETVWSAPGNYPTWLSNYTVNFENGKPGERDQLAHTAYGLGIGADEAVYYSGGRAAYLGYATITTDDATAPKAQKPSQAASWVNTSPAAPLEVDASDTGLGVKSVTFGIPGSEVTKTNLCGGQTVEPCPTNQHTTYTPTSAQLAALPTGNNFIPMTVKDVLGNWNTTPANALLKVDHAKPTLAFSGTMTEQASLGTTLPQYTLKYEAKDGATGAPQSGVASTEVKIDGKAVEAKYSPGCSTQNCAITKEWTLNSSAYSAGSHAVEVITTDAVGLQTTKSLTISLGKDSSKPAVTTTGAFFSGPEGWLEQKNYSATVKATDPGGYGVTSLLLKVDGSSVQTKSQTCTKGSCEASFTKTMNMALYEGGAHAVEVVATDGAGNSTTQAWTINVDPTGTVDAGEATATLEALEGTGNESQPVAPTTEFLEQQVIEAGDNPGWSESGGVIKSAGVLASSEIGPDGTVAIEGSKGTLEVTPASGISGEGANIEAGVAAVDGSSALGTDTVVRPEYNGIYLFTSIREAASPEEFSWHVKLGEGQELKSVYGGQFVEVDYEGGVPAYLIQAEPAHDATGKAVPSHLEVEGANITLVVEHRGGGFVYPVLAGNSYITGVSSVEAFHVEEEVVDPLPPWSAEEDSHALDFGPSEAWSYGPPFPIGPAEYAFPIYRSLCGKSCGRWKAKVYNAAVEIGPWGARWESGTKVMANVEQSKKWAPFYLADAFNCGTTGPNVVHKGSDDHLTAWANFNVTKTAGIEFNLSTYKPGETNFKLQDFVYPNGFQRRVPVGWNGAAPKNCPTVAG